MGRPIQDSLDKRLQFLHKAFLVKRFVEHRSLHFGFLDIHKVDMKTNRCVCCKTIIKESHK